MNAPPSGFSWSEKTTICPNVNCRYTGQLLAKSNGSTALMIFLLAFLFPIGIIYAVCCSGCRYYCPKCRTEIKVG